MEKGNAFDPLNSDRYTTLGCFHSTGYVNTMIRQTRSPAPLRGNATYVLGLSVQWIIAIGAGSALSAQPPTETNFSPASLEFFEKQVRPLLAKRCFSCHSGKSKSLKGNLRLDSRKLALRGGDTGPAIVPGVPVKSLLVDAINYGDVYQMPPKGKLPAAEIQILTEWVKQGAPWPAEDLTVPDPSQAFDLAQRKAAHWCWQPLRNYPLPTIGDQDWPLQDLDHFILAQLEKAGLTPATPADKYTLLRRVTLDLTGLTPTTEEIANFVADTSEQAYLKVINRLLASPRFGERWARHWLDLTRFAESYGHEADYPIRNAHVYRDYLIRAFNEDLPYNDFVVEQIAGDLLKRPRLEATTGRNESRIATGFWWLGEATHSPVDVRGDEAGRIDNQIDVMSKAFLGLTVACARCHDHKFDAISTRDYYALAGYLQSSRRTQAMLYPPATTSKIVKQVVAGQRETTALLGRELRSIAAASPNQFSTYLQAATEALHGSAQAGEPPERIVFADFETGNYGLWTATGTAFGTAPQDKESTPEYQGNLLAKGKHWVNSHNARDKSQKDADAHVGTLTSPTFTIEKSYIHFLVGGGQHPGKTCVNLLVDGETVRSQTGFNSNQMRPVLFDTTPWRGKQAQIQVVDREPSSWGNIGVDHFIFSDHPATAGGRAIQSVAATHQLNPALLTRWTRAIASLAKLPDHHPMKAWARLGHLPPDQFEKQLSDYTAAVTEQLNRAQAAESKYHPISTFAPDINDWMTDGPAFSATPLRHARIQPGHNPPQLLAVDSIHSGAKSLRLRGVLRTPTFEITHKNIFYRLRGTTGQVRIIIDGHFMFDHNGLLFNGVKFDVNKEDYYWHRQHNDVSRYVGHKAYIEIIDQGEGAVELAQLLQSDETSPPPPVDRAFLEITEDHPKNHAQLASAFDRQWHQAIQHWSDGKLTQTNVQIINWLLSNELLPLPDRSQQTIQEQSVRHRDLVKHFPEPTRALTMVDGSPEDERLFIRGNHKTLGAVVPRKFLTAIAGPQNAQQYPGSGRLDLAHKIAAPDNPLTARVLVNRVWHHLTGRGIVPSVDNFGVLGARPTHPELLDHLALKFISDGWSIKSLLRTVLLSQTYQMSSTLDPRQHEQDPENKLLHRMRMRRLQGEPIRDSILHISGELSSEMYGPSIPVHLTKHMPGRGSGTFPSGPLDGKGRRSIYILVRRNFLPPMMLAFDTPFPATCVGRRNVSNVPSQALILMNDPFIIQQMNKWAQKIVARKNESVEQRIERMYLRALGRPVTTELLTDLGDFLTLQRNEYQIDESQLLTDVRLWADLGHVLINTKPFIYID
ncbi:MAG: hypothetical protein CMJ75_02430 [Planctomycetaceae bacterium]|nr:hypothetical protein [Planctomycetaceae bacterium]